MGAAQGGMGENKKRKSSTSRYRGLDGPGQCNLLIIEIIPFIPIVPFTQIVPNATIRISIDGGLTDDHIAGPARLQM